MTRRTALAPLLALACAVLPPPAAHARIPQPPEPLFHVAGKTISEASGLAVSADGKRHYTVPDAGRPAEVYVVDRTGKTRAVLALPAAELNEDWEDIAVTRAADGTGRLHIADTGDAFAVRTAAGLPERTSYRLLRVAEPRASASGRVDLGQERVEVFPLVYADGAPHNSEALLVHPVTGRVFLVEKAEKEGRRAGLWSAPATLRAGADNVLRQALPDLGILGVSGAAFSPDGDRVVVRDATTAYLWWVKGGDVARSLRARPVEIDLPLQRQGEGVAFTPDGRALLVNSEGVGQPVWRVPLPADAVAAEPEPSERGPAPSAAPPAGGDGPMFAVAGLAGAAAAGVLALVVVRGRRRALSRLRAGGAAGR
ncbi:hypothetical protein ACFOWE_10725 [Planomonospora corallina]|uniref:WD40 repeat domain-containing protein n=1 Tax=Planomonospora corallina TaxID=1806052 RepID=A0ABV8I691_9ACTN